MTNSTKDMLGTYAARQRSQISDRQIDANALLRCASQLNAAIEEGGRDMKAYGDAIRLNQRLWTLFQVALSDPDNNLARDLKTLLLNLSRYVDRVSFNAVTAFSPVALKSLININRMVATGLNKSQAAEVQAPAEQYTPLPSEAAGSVMTTA